MDGEVVRREERKEGEGFPEKAMFLYASIWNASGISDGKWCGKYCGADEPYVCVIRTFVFLLPLLLTMSEFCFCDSESSGFVFFSFLASDVDGECGNASSLGYVG